MNLIQTILLLAITITQLSGCGIFGGKKDAEYLEPPKIVYSAPPVKKQSPREPGSLWSEDSNWNEIYCPQLTRSLGDVLTLNVSENFKSRVLTSMYPYKNFEQEKKEMDEAKATALAAASDTSKGDKKAGAGAAAAAAPAADDSANSRSPASTAAKDEPKMTEVTIVEVLSKGLYRVSANRGMRISDKNTFVSFEGTLREKDITNDNYFNSDSLLNLKVEVVQPEKLIPKPVVASNGTPGKTEMTPPPAANKGDKK